MPRPGPRRERKTIRLSTTEITSIQAIADLKDVEWSEAARMTIARGLKSFQTEGLKQ